MVLVGFDVLLRVVAFDHDGVGETKVPVEAITLQRHLETLLAVLDAQGVERCVIAGDSANAALAIEAVLASPERFEGLAVVNGHAWGLDRPSVRRFVDGLRADFQSTVDFFVGLVFPEPDSDHLKRWLRDIIMRTGAEAAARILEINYPVDLRPRLAEVGVPTVIVHGVLDAISPSALDDAKELAALIPGAELRLLRDAGHLPLLSRPDAVASILDGLLANASRAGR